MSPRRLILGAMHSLGLMKLWEYANRGKIPILTFHGVDGGQGKGDCRPIRPRLRLKDFKRYLDVLSQCFSFVSLEAAADMLSGRRPPQPYSLVLTFDDGYLNNATHVWPALMQYNVPGTFFLPTGWIGTGRACWVDRLDYAISHLRPGGSCININGKTYEITGRDQEGLRSLFWRIRNDFADEGWDWAERAVDVVELSATAKISEAPGSDHWARFMSWDQVRSMRREGASFGSHTVTHRPLDELSREEVMAELVESKAELERQTGATCFSLAYPRGKCNGEVAGMAQKAGYRCAVTTIEGPADNSDHPTLLPRIGLPSRPLHAFDLEARVTGLSAALSHLWGNGPRKTACCVQHSGWTGVR